MPGFKINGRGEGPPNDVETMRDHRWKIEVATGNETLTIMAQKCNRPVYVTDRVTIPQYQNEIYLPGRTKWEPVKASFYLGEDDTLQKLRDVRDKSILVEGTDQLNVQNMAWNDQYKTTVTITVLDGEGSGIYEYRLEGAWITRIEGPDFDYGSTAISIITVTFSYDYAVEQKL
ncbi:MAG: hypothetical protein DRN07_08710 [Thermoplasmata archaeon]|nr:MAG: hypothetical protein DRN07_08710 [Thermoplasmata archaeon]